MKYWLTSDTHFNHRKMIKYCDRPNDFEARIAKGLLKIPYGDILIHLGDVCVGKDDYVHSAYIKPLLCKKWLLRGNHDKKSNSWYLEHGWDFVGDEILVMAFGRKILFSHTPQEDTGRWDINIHGHFHNQLPRLLEKKWAIEGEEERNKYDLSVLTPKHKLLALEYTKYQPVDFESFVNK